MQRAKKSKTLWKNKKSGEFPNQPSGQHRAVTIERGWYSRVCQVITSKNRMECKPQGAIRMGLDHWHVAMLAPQDSPLEFDAGATGHPCGWKETHNISYVDQS